MVARFVFPLAAVLLCAYACDGRLKSTQSPLPASGSSERDAAEARAVPQDAGVADVRVPVTLERWACHRTNGSVVFQHAANIELRDDGSFELHHTNATQFGGWMSWVQGTWQRDASNVLVLTPVSALRRRWTGDAHRKIHGEKVDLRETEETITTAPWRLRPEPNGTLFIAEVQTHVGRLLPGAQDALACDDVRFNGAR